MFSAQMLVFPESVISWGIVLCPGLLLGKVFLYKIDMVMHREWSEHESFFTMVN